MAHALRVARSSGVVLFSYMAQPDFRRYTADRRDAAGQPPRTSKPHSGDTGVGLFFCVSAERNFLKRVLDWSRDLDRAGREGRRI